MLFLLVQYVVAEKLTVEWLLSLRCITIQIFVSLSCSDFFSSIFFHMYLFVKNVIVVSLIIAIAHELGPD